VVCSDHQFFYPTVASLGFFSFLISILYWVVILHDNPEPQRDKKNTFMPLYLLILLNLRASDISLISGDIKIAEPFNTSITLTKDDTRRFREYDSDPLIYENDRNKAAACRAR
jgi:hypothetical protein